MKSKFSHPTKLLKAPSIHHPRAHRIESKKKIVPDVEPNKKHQKRNQKIISIRRCLHYIWSIRMANGILFSSVFCSICLWLNECFATDGFHSEKLGNYWDMKGKRARDAAGGKGMENLNFHAGRKPFLFLLFCCEIHLSSSSQSEGASFVDICLGSKLLKQKIFHLPS